MTEWPVYNPPEMDLDDFQDMLESRLNVFVPFCLSLPPGDGIFNDDAVTARLSSPEGWLTLETGFSLTSGDRRSPGRFWACLTTPENSSDYHTMTVELNGLMDVKAVSMAVRAELGRLAVQDQWFRSLGFVCDSCLFLKYSLPLKLRGHDCVFEVERIGQDLYGTEVRNGVSTDVSYREWVVMPEGKTEHLRFGYFLVENQKGDAVGAFLDSFAMEDGHLTKPHGGDLMGLRKAELMAALPPEIRMRLVEA